MENTGQVLELRTVNFVQNHIYEMSVAALYKKHPKSCPWYFALKGRHFSNSSWTIISLTFLQVD